MSPWEAAALGLIQGITEFLPISSSGHLVMVQWAWGIVLPGILFEVVLHAATLASVTWAYRRRIGWILTGALRREANALRYVGLLALATLPAGVAGLVAEDELVGLFEDVRIAAGALIATGVVLWASGLRGESRDRAEARRDPDSESVSAVGRGVAAPRWSAALLIGVAQAFALVPGISRAGVTIAAGLCLGVDRVEAARFSFLMAIPAVAGAVVLSVLELLSGPLPDPGRAVGSPPDSSGSPDSDLGLALAVGFTVAAVTGVAAIRTLVAVLNRGAFRWFAPYCWVVGLLVLVLWNVGS